MYFDHPDTFNFKDPAIQPFDASDFESFDHLFGPYPVTMPGETTSKYAVAMFFSIILSFAILLFQY